MNSRHLDGTETGWWFVCDESLLWLPNGKIPTGKASDWKLDGDDAQYIGEWQGETVWLVCKKMGADMTTVRALLDQDKALFQLAGKAVQLAEFYRSHKYCGYCGQPMYKSDREWACLCRRCKQRYYPQIAPSIIVAIRRDDKILLAQHARHRSAIYTVLAGFVEVGETLEQAAAREIMEESQIEIQNLRYVSSQPWPFPHSLMVAYMADYKSGEINIDRNELVHADWFRYDRLPAQLPPAGTIARRLIEDTVILCRDSEFD
jgi:NAD+ diphosphatase